MFGIRFISWKTQCFFHEMNSFVHCISNTRLTVDLSTTLLKQLTFLDGSSALLKERFASFHKSQTVE